MKNCIIGYTGTVGTNIIKTYNIFDEYYNTANIDTINDNIILWINRTCWKC